MSEKCSKCGARPRLQRPLFDGESPPKLDVEIMKLKPKKGEIVVFCNLQTHEIGDLNRAIMTMREEKKIPDDFEILFFEGEVEPKYVPAVRDAIVKLTALKPQVGSIFIAAGLPLHLQRYLHITLRETGLMGPGTALVTLPEGTATIEQMERKDLLVLLNHLLDMGKK